MIENEARYEAAKERRIKQNARVGRSRRWLAQHADAQRLSNWLSNTGEFCPLCSCGVQHDLSNYNYDPTFNPETCRSVRHPAAAYGDFFAKMADSLADWGGLSDAQTEAVRKGLQKALDRAAGLDAATEARKARDAHSQHVAVVGKRADFEAIVEFIASYETQFGTTRIYGLRDDAGNILIAKGSSLFCAANYENPVEKGMKLRFAAFVKEHGNRDGIKQTILNRVKIKAVLGE